MAISPIPTSSDLCRVTIVMPVRNEGRFIKESLEAVLSQRYPKEKLEVIIADGMSTDGTREIVESFVREHGNVILIDNPNETAAVGLNRGIKNASGEIIIRVDGHAVVQPDYVEQCVLALQHSGADNVGGKMNSVGENTFGKAVAFATSSPFGVGDSRFHYSNKEEWVDTVYLGAWKRETFNKFGFFDEEFVRNQDDEFNYRLWKLGGRILLTPKIQSRYHARSTPLTLWKQYFQYGFWKVRVFQKHPSRIKLSQFLPALFVSSLLLSFLMAPLLPWVKTAAALIIVLYLVTNLISSAWISLRAGWRYILPTSLAYSIIHVAYGTGFLAGLIKFHQGWRRPRPPSYMSLKILFFLVLTFYAQS